MQNKYASSQSLNSSVGAQTTLTAIKGQRTVHPLQLHAYKLRIAGKNITLFLHQGLQRKKIYTEITNRRLKNCMNKLTTEPFAD